ncbi:MAG: hypothetical protein P4L56_26245, partial [Candidatus Sulfopaludibacter sp.]|nr:hypothetical protein [Candidatus Sulfopaludibacter sp.]
MRLLVMFCLSLPLAWSQETRHEVTNSTGAADARENSAAVPDVYAVPSQFERVLIFRFKYQADLLAGLEAMVKQNKIKNA